eukprot:59639-Amphidinium_carterae.4
MNPKHIIYSVWWGMGWSPTRTSTCSTKNTFTLEFVEASWMFWIDSMIVTSFTVLFAKFSAPEGNRWSELWDIQCIAMESRESVLEAVKQSWRALEHVGEIWKSDHEVVLTAVNENGHALEFAAAALKGDRTICACSSAEGWVAPPACLGGPQG